MGGDPLGEANVAFSEILSPSPLIPSRKGRGRKGWRAGWGGEWLWNPPVQPKHRSPCFRSPGLIVGKVSLRLFYGVSLHCPRLKNWGAMLLRMLSIATARTPGTSVQANASAVRGRVWNTWLAAGR